MSEINIDDRSKVLSETMSMIEHAQQALMCAQTTLKICYELTEKYKLTENQ